jgi:hypothetical protein
MNIVHEEVKDLLFRIDLDYVVFDTLDSIILKKMEPSPSCTNENHRLRKTYDLFWYETDGIFMGEVNHSELVPHEHELVCVKQSHQHEYFNASYAIQWEITLPTIIYIDEYRFNRNSIKDLSKWIDDIYLEQEKRKQEMK